MNMCEKCGQRYQPTLSVLDRGLCHKCSSEGLGTLGLRDPGTQLEDAEPVTHNPPEWGDFFISYYSAQEAQAARIDEIVRGMGKSTWFFSGGGGSGKFLREIQDALTRSHRMICVLSPGYFHSAHCSDELKAMWHAFERDEDGRIIFLEVGPCQVPQMYQSIRRTSLRETTPEEFEGKVQEAIERTERQYVDYSKPIDQLDEPRAKLVPPSSHQIPPRLLMAAVAMLVMGLYFLTYFRFGPQGVWDLREAATYATLGRDISLPWDWAMAPANWKEYVFAGESEALDHWRRPGGLPSQFESAGQFLRPVGVSFLRSTLPEAGRIERGIAQYRAVFAGQSIRLVADARPDGKAYRGFRLDNDFRGSLQATYFEKTPSGVETTLKTYPRKPVSASTTLHDIGVSKQDGFYTLYHNREVLGTWPPKDTTVARGWKGGAFGLAVDGSSAVRLFRWSLSLTRTLDGSVSVAKVTPLRPQLVSYFAMPGNPRVSEAEDAWED